MEGGVQGALFHTQQRRGGLLDVQRNAEAVVGTRGESLEDQQLQRGLRMFSTIHHGSHIVA
jgi:hypothetical protein